MSTQSPQPQYGAEPLAGDARDPGEVAGGTPAGRLSGGDRVEEPGVEVVLGRLGAKVRAERRAQGLTARVLAERSGLSPRFISQLESGRGNIAVGRLASVAEALGVELSALVEEEADDTRASIQQMLRGRSDEELRRALMALEVVLGRAEPQVVALLGLRGAGKSAVGGHLGARLGAPFIELDERIEAEAGLRLGEIFALHGEPYYRRLEARCLLALLAERRPAVVALSGGVVHNDEAFWLARQRCTTVWLRARPEEHMARVQAQGDHRPMANRRDAMAELRAILQAREPLYSLADFTVDTSGRRLDDVTDAILIHLQRP